MSSVSHETVPRLIENPSNIYEYSSPDSLKITVMVKIIGTISAIAMAIFSVGGGLFVPLLAKDFSISVILSGVIGGVTLGAFSIACSLAINLVGWGLYRIAEKIYHFVATKYFGKVFPKMPLGRITFIKNHGDLDGIIENGRVSFERKFSQEARLLQEELSNASVEDGVISTEQLEEIQRELEQRIQHENEEGFLRVSLEDSSFSEEKCQRICQSIREHQNTAAFSKNTARFFPFSIDRRSTRTNYYYPFYNQAEAYELMLAALKQNVSLEEAASFISYEDVVQRTYLLVGLKYAQDNSYSEEFWEIRELQSPKKTLEMVVPQELSRRSALTRKHILERMRDKNFDEQLSKTSEISLADIVKMKQSKASQNLEIRNTYNSAFDHEQESEEGSRFGIVNISECSHAADITWVFEIGETCRLFDPERGLFSFEKQSDMQQWLVHELPKTVEQRNRPHFLREDNPTITISLFSKSAPTN
ncbi:MAG: hypothetical protein JW769_02300 [Parachlamydiales bacterium]|nr:hypothetical protein [Parachlamydiales bacterium]